MAPYRELPHGTMPGVLIIAGLDPSGGAGFVADVRLAAALGCRPVGVVTALTDQNTVGVIAANPIDPAIVANQLSTLLTDIEVAAVKIGMIASPGIARAVADALALTAAPVVWDPVVAPTRGAPLFEGDLAAALAVLAPHLALITPNVAEAGLLTGRRIHDEADVLGAGQELRSRGVAAVLIKGGHLGRTAGRDAAEPSYGGGRTAGRDAAEPWYGGDGTAGRDAAEPWYGGDGTAGRDAAEPSYGGGGAESTDYLIGPGDAVPIRAARIPLAEPVHGTGCALSTAIACRLAHGISLREACEQAKELVAERLHAPVRAGRGRPSVL